MEERLRGARRRRRGRRVRRSFDGRLVGQSWETPFVDVPDGPITADTIAELIARFHAAYEQRYGNRFEMVPVQGVTYRVQLVVPAEKVRYEPLPASDGAAPRGPRRSTLRYFSGADARRPRSTSASSCRSGARIARPGRHPRADCRPRSSARDSAPRSAAWARSSSRRRGPIRRSLTATSTTPSSPRRYGCDRFTATVLGNRFRYIVEHMCSRLLTAAFSPILRDFYDFAATITGPPQID